MFEHIKYLDKVTTPYGHGKVIGLADEKGEKVGLWVSIKSDDLNDEGKGLSQGGPCINVVMTWQQLERV